MPAQARQIRKQTMLASDLHPPHSGPKADPVLYGVAAALAALFPPMTTGRGSTTTPGNPGKDDANAGGDPR